MWSDFKKLVLRSKLKKKKRKFVLWVDDEKIFQEINWVKILRIARDYITIYRSKPYLDRGHRTFKLYEIDGMQERIQETGRVRDKRELMVSVGSNK